MRTLFSSFSFIRLPLRGLAVALAIALLVPAAADAKRLGGGSSIGRQSSSIAPRAAAPSVSTPSASGPSSAAPAAGAAASARSAAAPSAPARSGASRWLGPIAGIAAGLGLAALLSHMGLSGAFAEFLSSALLIALAVFAVMFVARRFFRGVASPALQGAGGPVMRDAYEPARDMSRAPAGASGLPGAVAARSSEPRPLAQPLLPAGQSMPGDFDIARFQQEAKPLFVNIQALWDAGDAGRLHSFMTDDLLAEIKPQIDARGGAAEKTEIVILNAELLGVEAVSDGHVASVRYSGMLRESQGADAVHFEEVWNFVKPGQNGWLLAGIQQIPAGMAG